MALPQKNSELLTNSGGAKPLLPAVKINIMGKDVKKSNVHMFDIEELACEVLGLDYDEIDADTQIIEEKLFEELEIDLSGFSEIVNRLLPLIDVGKSPLTGEKYKGFSNGEIWLAKIPV